MEMATLVNSRTFQRLAMVHMQVVLRECRFPSACGLKLSEKNLACGGEGDKISTYRLAGYGYP